VEAEKDQLWGAACSFPFKEEGGKRKKGEGKEKHSHPTKPEGEKEGKIPYLFFIVVSLPKEG